MYKIGPKVSEQKSFEVWMDGRWRTQLITITHPEPSAMKLDDHKSLYQF